ncbi:LINE-1 reverse transcriptase isogeny [Gossypium australe]|uniref:LINE-1 reverse transcriptase isogeny n=1 Tax=Gossypium australe TaxID=47621 RepID=A0A5B6VXD8_9ROSI|nr:LINE-1 reverse transcriptase isogeny [Gossypium australe]
MEWLGHSIRNANEVGNWSPIRLARDGLLLSHLFFAGDLILFGHADDNQAWVMKDILDEFCDYSGHRINMQKTNIFFSKSVDYSLRMGISDFFGFQEVTILGHYLGVPLLHDKVTSSTLCFVVDIVHITLAQLILLSIPTYFMQMMMVPKSVCDKIECMVRKFVWGSYNGSSKMALVS